MPSKKKTNGSKLQAQSKQQTKSKKRRSASVPSLGASQFTRMVTDPCNAPLVPGFYGSEEGYLARFHKTDIPYASASNSGCGVVLWVPDFTNEGYIDGNNARYNCIIAEPSGTGTQINLSGCTGLGAVNASSGVRDPAYDFVDGTICGDFRTLSACVRWTNIGPVSEVRGLVGVIDMPFNVMEDAFSGGQVMSVDGLFSISQRVVRAGFDTIEVKATPPLDEPVFKDSGRRPGDRGDYLVDFSTGTYTTSSTARSLNPRVIGFVYKGFGATATTNARATVNLDFYKNIEWRPQPSSGITTPTPIRSSGVTPSKFVIAALDRADPNWRYSAMHAAESVASKVIKNAWSYGGRVVARNAPKIAGFLM